MFADISNVRLDSKRGSYLERGAPLNRTENTRSHLHVVPIIDAVAA